MKQRLFVFGWLAALCAGCGPQLSDQRDLTIDVGEIVAIPIDPISRAQTIRVTGSSIGGPLDVHIYLKEHETAIERKITLGKPPENLLAEQDDVKEISLEAVIPANKEAVVRLQSASRETANVQLNITN